MHPIRLSVFNQWSSLRRLCLIGLLGLAALTLGGCQSFESRAKEKAGVFDALDDPTKVRLEAREIHIGDTMDMVYIALGKPTEKQEKISASGRSGLWTYSAYWQEYQGTRFVGYRRNVIFNPATKSYQVIYTPDYQPIYAPRVEDRIRITFEGGRVSVVEQAKTDSEPDGGTGA